MPKFAELTDTFATADAAKWVYDAGVGVSGGQLVVPCTAAYPGVNSVLATYDLTDSAATVELVSTPNLGNGSTSAIFALDTADNLSPRIATPPWFVPDWSTDACRPSR
jgi:hypothetical protein